MEAEKLDKKFDDGEDVLDLGDRYLMLLVC